MIASKKSREVSHLDEVGELRRLLSEQRDKHLAQLMAINGRLAFGALASVLVFSMGTKDFDLARSFVMGANYWHKGAFVVGALLLVVASWVISSHHSSRIRSLQAKIVSPMPTLEYRDFEIIPSDKPPYPFLCIFFGLGLMAFSVVCRLVSN